MTFLNDAPPSVERITSPRVLPRVRGRGSGLGVRDVWIRIRVRVRVLPTAISAPSLLDAIAQMPLRSESALSLTSRLGLGPRLVFSFSLRYRLGLA